MSVKSMNILQQFFFIKKDTRHYLTHYFTIIQMHNSCPIPDKRLWNVVEIHIRFLCQKPILGFYANFLNLID